MSFISGKPPNLILEGSQFIVGINLINHIPKSVEGAQLCIIDTPADYYGGIQGEDCRSFSMVGTSYWGEEEETHEEEFIFNIDPYRDLEKGVDDTTIIATLKTPLETNSNVEVCLFKSHDLVSDEVKCSDNVKFIGNQIDSDFAPLIVDKIDMQIFESEFPTVGFDIYFKKSPIGNLIDEGSNKEKFKFDIYFGSRSTPFECSVNDYLLGNNNILEMNGLTKRIYCSAKFDVGDQPFLKDKLHIDMFYTYKTTISSGTIELQKSGAAGGGGGGAG